MIDKRNLTIIEVMKFVKENNDLPANEKILYKLSISENTTGFITVSELREYEKLYGESDRLLKTFFPE